MKRKIEMLWQDKNEAKEYNENCKDIFLLPLKNIVKS